MNRTFRGLIGLILISPLIAYKAIVWLTTAVSALSSKSITVYGGYPGYRAAEFHFAAADRPIYYAVSLLESVDCTVFYGGCVAFLVVASWRQLRNDAAPARALFSPRSSAMRVWIASAVLWLAFCAIFPIVLFVSIV